MTKLKYYVVASLFSLVFLGFVLAMVWAVDKFGPTIEAAFERHRVAQNAAEKRAFQEADNLERDSVVAQIKYVRDHRTNPPTCYGYTKSYASGENMLAGVIDCASIPPELFASSQR